jgi:hypothetical protein
MNWIETWFGISPDAGTGALEISLVVILLVIAGLCSWRVHISTRAEVRNNDKEII